MTFARPLFFVVLLLAAATTICLAADSDDAAKPQASAVGSLQNQVGDTAPFGAFAQDLRPSPGLFFLKNRPRLSLTPPALQPRSAMLDDNLCLTLRMYKVKRTERLSDNESASRGYTTCELATNYQVRSAIAHPRTADDSRNNGLQK